MKYLTVHTPTGPERRRYCTRHLRWLHLRECGADPFVSHRRWCCDACQRERVERAMRRAPT